MFLDIGTLYLSLKRPRIINYNYWQLLFFHSQSSRWRLFYVTTDRIVTVMWNLYLYICTNFMVCKRQYASQFGTEIVWSVRKTASASGGLHPQTSYRGFAPGPHWGTSVPQWGLPSSRLPARVIFMCPLFWTVPAHLITPINQPTNPPNNSWRRPWLDHLASSVMRSPCGEFTLPCDSFCDEFTVWWKSELVTVDSFTESMCNYCSHLYASQMH